MPDLPSSFPEGTSFFDVEGVPVSLVNGVARAWDCGKPRWFPFNSIDRNEIAVSESKFRAMVAARESANLAADSSKANPPTSTGAPHSAEQTLAEAMVSRFVEDMANETAGAAGHAEDGRRRLSHGANGRLRDHFHGAH
jgi:hypothetical protein